MFESIDALQEALLGVDYVADRALATTLFLALKLDKPVLLEGEAGVVVQDVRSGHFTSSESRFQWRER